jgi:antitoxin component YwqK of YwqJK toxin-antitoxin module
MIKSIYILIFFTFFQVSGQKKYFKDYFENGKLKSEGWLNQNQKEDYWFFYNENGSKKEEGHFANNKKCNWWIFYKSKEEISMKCEFENDKMNGFCLIYKNDKIVRAEKFQNDLKIKQWNSVTEFKKDNPLF